MSINMAHTAKLVEYTAERWNAELGGHEKYAVSYWAVTCEGAALDAALKQVQRRGTKYYATEADAQAAVVKAIEVAEENERQQAAYDAAIDARTSTGTTFHGDGRYTDHYSDGFGFDREEW